MRLVFCCKPQNDLYRLLCPPAAAVTTPLPRFDTPLEAVEAAATGSGVAILADSYPQQTTVLDSALLARAASRRLRLYVEYPSMLPGVEVGPARQAVWERAVVSSEFFGPGLQKLRILAIHDCHFVPVKAAGPHLVMSRVAGFDTAVYGLPTEAFPILFEARDGLLVATTKLSQFISARYAPTAAWQEVWTATLGWLCPGQSVPELNWVPTVRPSFAAQAELPAEVEVQACQRGATWFQRSGLLARESTERELAKGVRREATAVGDGSHGIMEGFGAGIRQDGRQDVLAGKRSDCNGESAMGLAIGAAIRHDAESGKVAANILDYWLTQTVAQREVRADPNHPTFGLIAWGVSSWALEKAYYGDDNARFLLGTLASAALLQTDRWDEAILRCLLANLRTTGRYGFRNDRIDIENLEANGWRHYYEGFTVSYAPHYQAYLWACYLWAYRATSYEPFLQRAESAIRMTMAAYPDKWRWTNGIAQERARMILPLAWLVRLKDTPEHRQWLRRVSADLLSLQAPCGAIREELGKPGLGSYGPPRSNEEYGTNEATLMQANGDPLCDLLYTTNFAFIGLHEAALATGDHYYAAAEDRLAQFLCRIQVRSEAHPELDGGWFRAFEFERWEYWASSADAGWGAWSIETGWTQGWITTVFGLRQLRTSLWDLTAGSRIGTHLGALRPLFFPDGDQVGAAGLVEHLALGRPVALAVPPSPSYPGTGEYTLADGRRGAADYRDPAWLGFEGPDLDATVDLGEPRQISTILSGYLQDTKVGIFLPTSVEYAVSQDGVAFAVVGAVTNETPAQQGGPLTRDFRAELPETTARYVRVRARSIATIPGWHAAKGRKAWLFVDEIIVR